MKFSLENYLLFLVVLDEYNNDVLWFMVFWLERLEEDVINEVVKRYIGKVLI